MKINKNARSWFMSHDREVRGDVTLFIREDFNKTAYFGDFKFGKSSILVRWDLDSHARPEERVSYENKEDVDNAINEGFAYCFSVISSMDSY
jgi:hypothetical protein